MRVPCPSGGTSPAARLRPKDLDFDFSKSFMVCADAEEKTKDQTVCEDTRGGYVANMFDHAAGDIVHENRWQKGT